MSKLERAKQLTADLDKIRAEVSKLRVLKSVDPSDQDFIRRFDAAQDKLRAQLEQLRQFKEDLTKQCSEEALYALIWISSAIDNGGGSA